MHTRCENYKWFGITIIVIFSSIFRGNRDGPVVSDIEDWRKPTSCLKSLATSSQISPEWHGSSVSGGRQRAVSANAFYHLVIRGGGAAPLTTLNITYHHPPNSDMIVGNIFDGRIVRSDENDHSHVK